MSLTKLTNGVGVLDRAAFPEYAQETLEREMYAFPPFRKAIQALAEYEATESLKLPCSLGDPLYWIAPEDDDGNEIPTIKTNTVGAILITPEGVRVCDETMAQECIEISDEINTPYAYIDRKKAEKALKNMKRKHDLMYELFGMDATHICKDCCNFCHCIARSGRRWSKCAIYGVSWCSSTDWNGKKEACGRFNIPLKDNEITVIELKKHSKKDKPQIQCSGQISMEELLQ